MLSTEKRTKKISTPTHIALLPTLDENYVVWSMSPNSLQKVKVVLNRRGKDSFSDAC